MVFENLVPPLCAFASLRLGETESSHSGGGSRKGAKTQRSQREDPGYVWTKFSKTINPRLNSDAATRRRNDRTEALFPMPGDAIFQELLQVFGEASVRSQAV